MSGSRSNENLNNNNRRVEPMVGAPGPNRGGGPVDAGSKSALVPRQGSAEDRTQHPQGFLKRTSFQRQRNVDEKEGEHWGERDWFDSGFEESVSSLGQGLRRTRSKDQSDGRSNDVDPACETHQLDVPKPNHPLLKRSWSSSEKTDNELKLFLPDQRRCSSDKPRLSSGYETGTSQEQASWDWPNLSSEGEEEDEDEKKEGQGNGAVRLDDSGNPASLRDSWEQSGLSRSEGHAEQDAEGAISSRDSAHPDSSRNVERANSELSKDSDFEDMAQQGLRLQIFHGLSERYAEHASWDPEQVKRVIHCAVDQTSSKDLAVMKMEYSFPECDKASTPSVSLSIACSSEDIFISSERSSAAHVGDTEGEAPNQHSETPATAEGTHEVDDEPITAEVVRGGVLNGETKNDLQIHLEQLAYCQAMKTPYCKDCALVQVLLDELKEHYWTNELASCMQCRQVAEYYWIHSTRCRRRTKCLVPFCDFFKELRNGILEELGAVDSFTEAFACLQMSTHMYLLEKFHDLEELKKKQVNGHKIWAANDLSASLAMGHPNCSLHPLKALGPFGHFAPLYGLVCRKSSSRQVVIKKVTFTDDLAAALELLSAITDSCWSVCLWYRQLNREKLITCSTYFEEKPLSDLLPIAPLQQDEFFQQAIDAAITLHEQQIIYLNWKVEHLIVRHRTLQLCNFSCAMRLQQASRDLSGLEGGGWQLNNVPAHVMAELDPRIAPPEVLKGTGLSLKSDTWGLGCLMYQLKYGGALPGHKELCHLSDEEVKQKRLLPGYKYLPQAEKYEPFDSCWNHQEERPLPGELLRILRRDREFQDSPLFSSPREKRSGSPVDSDRNSVTPYSKA